MDETQTFPESKVRAEFINTSVAVDMVKLSQEGKEPITLTCQDAMRIMMILLDRSNRNTATPPIRLQ